MASRALLTMVMMWLSCLVLQALPDSILQPAATLFDGSTLNHHLIDIERL